MTVTETSREAYESITECLGNAQSEVLAMIECLGPCHNNRILEALQQADRARPRNQRRGVPWVSNNCWPRVTELMMLKVVVNMGKFQGRWSGRAVSMNFRRVSGDQRLIPAGWVRVQQREPIRMPKKVIDAAERLKMGASVAGRKLREYRKVKGRKTTEPTGQLVFW